jgi:lysophospholipase L1-like esterase
MKRIIICLALMFAFNTGMAQGQDYAKGMKEVAKTFTGDPGKVVPLGDSITYANQAGKWARQGKGLTQEESAICKWMKSRKNDKSNGWWLAANDQPRGRSWTAASGITSGQYIKGGKRGLPSLQSILKTHNPQIALILLGTNDLKGKVKPEAFTKNMKTIYQACIDNGTIPVAQTVPPCSKKWDPAGQIDAYNEGIKKLAKEMSLPFIDVHAEFLKRQPGENWLGTLVSGDGAHLTHKVATGPANKTNLANCGYLLRCWLQVHKVMEIKKQVID